MCTFALIGLGLSVGGAVMEGAQQQEMANLQAKAYNQQAEADSQASAFEQAQERHKQELQQAAARAQVGASGVAVAGSPTEVMAANAKQNQLDLKAIQYGSQVRQNNLNTQAAISRYSGKQAMAAGIIKGATTGFTGLAKIQMSQSPFQ